MEEISTLKVPIKDILKAHEVNKSKLPPGLKMAYYESSKNGKRHRYPYWQFLYYYKGNFRRLGLGRVDDISQVVAEARMATAQKHLEDGEDPMRSMSVAPKEQKNRTRKANKPKIKQEIIVKETSKATSHSNPIHMAIRAIVKEELAANIPEPFDRAELIARIVHQEVVRMFQGTGATAPRKANGAEEQGTGIAHVSPPALPRANARKKATKKKTRAARVVQFGPETIVRINNTSRGPENARGLTVTQPLQAWKAVKEYLGVDSMNRTVLARQLETLMGWAKPVGSNMISALLKQKCLLVTDVETKKS